MAKRTVSFLSVLVMLFTLCTSVFALDNSPNVQPYYVHASEANADLTISSGTATYSGSILGDSSVTRIDVELTLQKKSLLWWSDVETWNRTSYNVNAGLAKSKSVGSGTYRTKVVFTVYSGSSSEDITVYSTEKSC